MLRMKQIIIIATFLLTYATWAFGQQSNTPTMGWSSWNTYRVNISDELIRSQADALVRLGLKDVGYDHINIDDGYFGGRNNETGELIIHPTRFPNGLQPVVDYIHTLGLKAGIYSDAGANTCGCWYDNDTIAKGVGFYGHDQQDADFFFRQLGFDFIKIDFCGGNSSRNSDRLALSPQERYTAIAQAIAATGRKDVRMNVCRWDYPGTWVSDVATSWRMSRDITCRWAVVKEIIKQNLYLSAYASPGHFNDMDMLEVGRTLTEEEDRTHFGIWCMMSSPLLIGCDMTKLKPATLELLKNEELIAINQDVLGQQAYVVKAEDGCYVLVKDLKEMCGLTRAVALYNPTDTMKNVSISLSDIDLDGKAKIRDVFSHTDSVMRSQDARSELCRSIPAHGVRIFTVTAKKRLERTVYEAETAFLPTYQELYNPLAIGSAFYKTDSLCSGGMKVTNLGGRPENDLQWRNVFSKEGGEYLVHFKMVGDTDATSMYISANGGRGQKVNDDEPLTVTLRKGINTIRLYNDKGKMPEVDYMRITKK